jgi:dolichol-phosphate mannosyltransferase
MIQSKGDFVVLLDGDLQDPPEIISDFVKEWEKGYDVVYGIRNKRQGNRLLNFFYKSFYRLFQKLSYIHIPLDAGDFSLMDKKVVQILNSLPEKDRYLRGLRAWVGFKQTGVKYVRPERPYGVSTNNIFSNIRWAKKGIFSFSFIPLEFVSYLSFLVIFLSAIALIIYLLFYFFSSEVPEGFTTVIILILFLGGIQLLSISFLSEYISKILEETKNRPKFIIKEIINDNKNKRED